MTLSASQIIAINSRLLNVRYKYYTCGSSISSSNLTASLLNFNEDTLPTNWSATGDTITVAPSAWTDVTNYIVG
jgi:hypothetical protein